MFARGDRGRGSATASRRAAAEFSEARAAFFAQGGTWPNVTLPHKITAWRGQRADARAALRAAVKHDPARPDGIQATTTDGAAWCATCATTSSGIPAAGCSSSAQRRMRTRGMGRLAWHRRCWLIATEHAAARRSPGVNGAGVVRGAGSQSRQPFDRIVNATSPASPVRLPPFRRRHRVPQTGVTNWPSAGPRPHYRMARGRGACGAAGDGACW